MFSECFKVFLALFDIWAENRIFEPRIGFSKKFLKKPQNMFSWCFLSVSRYFSIVRNLCWEPHFWTENRIFKNFLKSLKTCFVGVFWAFQCIFLALFDIWAENRIFEPRTRFSRNSWKASKHVWLVFSGCFVFFLALFDIRAENRIFEPRTVFSKHFFKSL